MQKKNLRSMTGRKSFCKKILLLGAGELGKELTIALKRLGQTVIAVDKYEGAPAMQVADGFEIISMLDASALFTVVKKHKPDLIVPEIEAIRTEALFRLEAQGYAVVPTAEAVHLTMNRNAIRDVAANELKLKTARFLYAESESQLLEACTRIGFPCVVKPVMSSSGKGQSVVSTARESSAAWRYACAGMRGATQKVIVEEFIRFTQEITLLTIRQRDGSTVFVDPIGHRQERGDYQESWLPALVTPAQLKAMKAMARKVTSRLGGVGLFGVEFFIGEDGEIYFSELSPRPHDTGMVTMISQDLSEFDLHARAILGLPLGDITYRGPAASAVILASSKIGRGRVSYSGLNDALAAKNIDVRIFGKPEAHPFRRMGVALALGSSIKSARRKAREAAARIKVISEKP